MTSAEDALAEGATRNTHWKLALARVVKSEVVLWEQVQFHGPSIIEEFKTEQGFINRRSDIEDVIRPYVVQGLDSERREHYKFWQSDPFDTNTIRKGQHFKNLKDQIQRQKINDACETHRHIYKQVHKLFRSLLRRFFPSPCVEDFSGYEQFWKRTEEDEAALRFDTFWTKVASKVMNGIQKFHDPANPFYTPKERARFNMDDYGGVTGSIRLKVIWRVFCQIYGPHRDQRKLRSFVDLQFPLLPSSWSSCEFVEGHSTLLDVGSGLGNFIQWGAACLPWKYCLGIEVSKAQLAASITALQYNIGNAVELKAPVHFRWMDMFDVYSIAGITHLYCFLGDGYLLKHLAWLFWRCDSLVFLFLVVTHKDLLVDSQLIQAEKEGIDWYTVPGTSMSGSNSSHKGVIIKVDAEFKSRLKRGFPNPYQPPCRDEASPPAPSKRYNLVKECKDHCLNQKAACDAHNTFMLEHDLAKVGRRERVAREYPKAEIFGQEELPKPKGNTANCRKRKEKEAQWDIATYKMKYEASQKELQRVRKKLRESQQVIRDLRAHRNIKSTTQAIV